MITKTVLTASRKETIAIAKSLGELINEPITILLRGELAAGKTTFVQGLAVGLDVTTKVSSPTFTIMKVYEGRLTIYHLDCYRLEGISQDLGFEEYLNDDGVCVIEWPDFIINLLPRECIEIELMVTGENSREIQIKAAGKVCEKIVEELP